MKAFGVRLAAGAVTILLGAIMAAQAQKDQQASTESAWTEDHIPPAKAVPPIGTAAKLLASDPMEIEALKPIGEEQSGGEQPAAAAVRLAQYTEPIPDSAPEPATESVATMGLPVTTASSNTGGPNADSSPDASAAGQPVLKMRLPGFDDVPPAAEMEAAVAAGPESVGTESAGTESAGTDSAGPAFAMGMPIPDAAASTQSSPSLTAPPKISAIQFADTPSAPSSQEPGSQATGLVASDVDAAAPPNDLRGNMGFGQPMTAPETIATEAASGPQTGFAPQPGFAPETALADTVDAAAGVPAAMLSQVLPEDQDNAAAELAAAPASTMRIHREPPVQLQIGAEAAPMPTSPNMAAAAQRTATPPAATLDITSQPQIVGNDGYGNIDDGQFNQPTAALTGNLAMPGAVPAAAQGYTQPAGGFAVPGESGSTAAAAVGPAAGALPPLPAPTYPANGVETPGMQSQPGFAQAPTGAIGSPAVGATGGGFGSPQPIYQGVSHQVRGVDHPLPAGPTMASPGERFLDGPQSPSVVIHKRAPTEVKVGKPASFVITVKNVGRSTALDVCVHDRVPTGMTLTDATPRPNPKFQPELYWELGDLEPNQERTITLQLTPEQEGELGSVARVTFEAAASVRTISTRPELKIVQKVPKQVLIGQQVEIELEVSNPGTGEATGVVLQEDVPAGLEHPQGPQLDNLVGNLGPGEIRRQILRMRAVKPGIVQNQIRVKADDGLETTHTAAIEVIAPELKATLTGPSRRYLERQATYQLEIANTGTADATNVELSVQLDRGFTFVKTDFEGQYDASRHAVFWSLPALPVGQSGKVPLTLLPVEEGRRVLRTDASADLGIKTSSESQVDVDSLAELTFSIADSADPIEVGGDTVYEIRINNTGSRDDTNVRVALQLPQGLKLVEQGDFTPQGQGVIEFSPRALLKANDEIVYKVKARGVTPGRHLVKAIVTSDQSDVPVTKEESIKVYADR